MITLDGLTKTFNTPSGPVLAVDRVSMEVPEGEICILLGPSGCGKTTTLKMVNRLIPKSSGRILVGGQDTDGMDPTEIRRGMGYVIQQIGLFPNMTVEENICVVPRLLGWQAPRMKRRAAELLEMVALDPALFLRRYPRELSGGQQQRVGVARALAADPPVMIMDEPFGAIDPINREVIQDEFLRMQQSLRKTILFVSHDIDEAVKMGDKVAIFRAGRLAQFGTPDDVLAHPADDFIADFVGADRTLKRLRLVLAKDALDPATPRIAGDGTTDAARALMQEHGHEAIVLVDAEGRPRGWIAAADAEQGAGHAGDHLRPLPALLPGGADLRAAVSLMFTHDMPWLACVDESGRFLGRVSQAGITRLLGETYRRAATEPPPP
ncbi:MAG: ABC transporter ATP-binding protein [Acetobacteraceae bacterium]|nr:ABC transporter ATP-binding protein [Acetobacteraceae bacterium]